jgi:predicted Zn-dependent peptidase
MKQENFARSRIHNIRLHVLPTDRFKTYAISAYIGSPLREDRVTPIALTPFVLRRGTANLPETKQFRERLDELFGAGFGFDIYKRGDYQMVHFRLDIIQDNFVGGNQSLLKQALQFLGDAITNPVTEEGHFRTKYVQSEKENLRKRIESVINDKVRYAGERCIEEMCKNEPYRLRALGTLEALESLNEEGLYDQYRTWLQESPIDLYVVGNTTLEEVESYVSAAFAPKSQPSPDYRMNTEFRVPEHVHTVVEELDVKQGKLNLGIRLPVTYADPEYAAALMYNGILGGYPHSKMFLNVREKESLAYYASSRFDGHKGILTIQSGIEMDNYEKALDIIQKQLDAMRAGEISSLEMTQTRAMIENQLREMNDSAFEMIGFDFNSILSGKERSVPELIEGVASVDVQAIQDVASKTALDTVYFLRDRKGE